ncbi:U-box domain-containing 44-like [Olea europaea subsp. europaea]|uniref:U-box domain-containing 44-like n=1 Tax=Olea europaea subsp. europaea TaxID=158383 RepID=A0A8S0VG34_OLEEU|nr:U-box domain-containing 44-like [Olea europaea subsp. europaea]CAA3031497.1 U-box domain-containing 44-like [Olea europaea subsp. europaea]
MGRKKPSTYENDNVTTTQGGHGGGKLNVKAWKTLWRFFIRRRRSIAKSIEDITKEITHAVSCIPLASIDISLGTREDIDQLVDNMRNDKFRAAIAEEKILGKIESGTQERNVDRSYAYNLLVSIAKAVGVPTD